MAQGDESTPGERPLWLLAPEGPTTIATMASTLLTLLDDIAVLLDDIAVMTKVAGKKTAAVLGDDLALNAKMVTGVKPKRELPVVWAVAKGSALNKVILVPAALAISLVLPAAIKPLLVLGGLFLCYEGAHKIAARLWPPPEKEARRKKRLEALATPSIDLVAMEKSKIKGAVRTDFILSAEVIAISLAAVDGKPLGTQTGVLVAISALMTVGVYGLVALIVKMDDAGLHLSQQEGGAAALGRGILFIAPRFMTALSFLGTAAMFLVGGGILVHALPATEAWVAQRSAALGSVGGMLGPTVFNGLVGLAAGGVIVALLALVARLRGGPSESPA